LFKPVGVEAPLSLVVPGAARDGSLWWQHEALHRVVMRDVARGLGAYAAERDALEAAWLREAPTSAAAFAAHAAVLPRWLAAARGAVRGDARPWWVRRYWARRGA